MDIKDKVIQEYLTTGCGYRKLQEKYGIGRTTICHWVQVYQGIHGLAMGATAKVFANAQSNTQKDNLFQDVLS